VTANATNPCIASCPVPCILVTKEIACAPAGDCTPGLSYSELATGVASGTNQTAFCYRIGITNCGNDRLTNVMVVDPDLGGVLVGFPTTLEVGQRTNLFFKRSWGVGTHTNTVVATGNGSSTGQVVRDTNTAVAVVVPISVVCDITLFSSFDMDNNTNDNHVTLPDSGPVELKLVVCNTGQANLNVAISGAPCVLTPITNLLAGRCVTQICVVDVTCPAGTNIEITVVGTAVASTNVPCVLDSNGRAITTAPSTCEAEVECQPPVSCRTTGGGVLNFGVVDRSCIDVETTLFPDSVNGLELDHVSHGGQLGAPFSQMDCGAILGNPCIRGQWQHTRHYKGKGNPRDVIDMNFHSNTPKGVFDSLFCACLGCCTTEGFQPGFVGRLHNNQKFALCNPDDHKVCGPQPRPAPANAIIFSGVGTIKPEVDGGQGASNKAAEYVVFRVYIEDRSEPGGHFPGGAVEPSDIYCFQAWKTGIKVSKKPDFTTVANAFRTALGAANCEFLDDLSTGALPIGTLPSPTVNGVTADIQDCGPLDRGNHQIHPSTSATCTE
jgi:hypothetical protein